MVDDEINILEGYRRQYRNAFHIETAQGAEEGLLALGSKGPFAAVISDFSMPGMNGVQFLQKTRDMAPDTVRIMLTGFADVRIAQEAMREGTIFQFLTKPCTPENLIEIINSGMAHVARPELN